MNINEIKEKAKNGNVLIEEAIINLLQNHAEGLSNSEIASILNLNSSNEGAQKDYLTYSILGNLMAKGKVRKVKISSRKVKYYYITC